MQFLNSRNLGGVPTAEVLPHPENPAKYAVKMSHLDQNLDYVRDSTGIKQYDTIGETYADIRAALQKGILV